MGNVYALITLKNIGDLAMVSRGLINDSDIRAVELSALVDTGAITLIISDAVCEELGLGIQETTTVTLANDDSVICKIADPVEIQWKQRRSVCRPWVLPGAGEVLLGVIPLEDMDLMVDPKKQELTGRHGEKQVGMAKCYTK